MAFDKRLPKGQRNAIKSGRRFAKQVSDRQIERELTAIKQDRVRILAR